MRWLQKLVLPSLIAVAIATFYGLRQMMHVEPLAARWIEKEQRFQEKYSKYMGPSVEEVISRMGFDKLEKAVDIK